MNSPLNEKKTPKRSWKQWARVKTVSDNSKQSYKLSFDYVKKMESFKSQVQKRACSISSVQLGDIL